MTFKMLRNLDYRVLNSLYGLSIEKSEKAPDMILKLSEIMRYTIYNGQADAVSLDQEISYLKDYIELYKIRYHKKVSALEQLLPQRNFLRVQKSFLIAIDKMSHIQGNQIYINNVPIPFSQTFRRKPRLIHHELTRLKLSAVT